MVHLKTKRIGGFIAFALTLFALAASPTAMGQQAPVERRSILSDPAVRAGVLPNGMRYAIMPSTVPQHGLSMRLGINVGSFEEQDSERGFAHFIEHMAFRATRSAPEGGLDRRFAALGIKFGRDQNAATTTLVTTYRLDYAAINDTGLDEGFRWLRDVADGVLFTDAGIATERGVLLAERESRSGPQATVQQAIAKFQAAGAREPERDPIGTLETLTVARTAALQAFYDRWYRPENAVLVVSGDQPPDVIEAKIRAAFGSWQAKGTASARALPGRVDFSRGIASFNMAAPGFPSFVSACRNRPPRAADQSEMARYTSEIGAALWRDILNLRFQALVSAGQSGLLGAAMVDKDSREYGETCLIVVPIGDGWEKALASAQAELRRYIENGPTEAEVEAQVNEGRAILRGGIHSAGARTASDRADTILGRLLEHRPVMSPREEMHAYDLAIEDIDPAAVKTAGAAQWAGSGPLLTVVLPTAIDPGQLQASWAANAARPALAAFTDQGKIAWPYTDFGKPGTVAKREEIIDPGFVRLRFANGVILNFKHTELEPNGIELRAQFGAGRYELPDGSLLPASLGAGLLAEGGLGRLSAADIRTSLRDTSWNFKLDIGTDTFMLSRSTSKANVEILLQVFAAFMTDPGFRPAIDERLPGAMEVMYRLFSTQPQMAVSEAMLAAVDPGSPDRMPDRAAVASWHSTDFARLLRPALTEAPVELTIVGDIDEASATRLVAATFGALPPRTAADRAHADTRFTRFPDRGFPIIRTTHGGPPDRAAATLIWPLYVAEPARRREEYALKLLAGVFNDDLRRRTRVELGKTYSPEVATAMPDYANQGMLYAQIEGQPADIETLVSEGQAVASKLVSGAITQEDIDAVRTPLLASAVSARSRNGWWAAAMSGSARNPSLTAEVTQFVPLMSSITLDEVKAAAAKWLARNPIITIATPRAAANPGTVSADPAKK